MNPAYYILFEVLIWIALGLLAIGLVIGVLVLIVWLIRQLL